MDVLRLRARSARDATAFIFDGDGGELPITYGELDAQARATAAALQAAGAPGAGARVLLLYPPGLDYVAALFGCFYAGAVAVPAYPPDPFRLERTLPRLAATLRSARVDAILTTAAIRSLLEQHLGGAAAGLLPATVLATPPGTLPEPEGWRPPAPAPEDLALLQYTSGSTAAPRGVMLTHHNLVHNSAFIRDAFGHSSRSRAVIWLPPYHDMGLIGGVLQPVFAGFPCVLMPPLTFLRTPLRWLAAITRFRATGSGGPNFAYDLCVRRISPEQRAGLDLRSWEVAFNGSEPVRSETLDAFAEAFAGSGFRRDAFYPCYGLAESTLMVTGGARGVPARIRAVSRAALEERRIAVDAGSDAPAKTVVSCGRPARDHRVAIVNPVSRSELAEDRVGEIWVSGPSVAAGYWGLPADTGQTFPAAPAGSGSAPVLRTGDLGFLSDGELFVTGRIRELIIVAGRNLHPLDLELACEEAVPELRRGCGAAFAYESERGAEVGIAYEVADGAATDHDRIIASIRRAVGGRFDVRVAAVALVKPRTIPKTSSGKVQRGRCRDAFLAGELETAAAWPAPRGAGAGFTRW